MALAAEQFVDVGTRVPRVAEPGVAQDVVAGTAVEPVVAQADSRAAAGAGQRVVAGVAEQDHAAGPARRRQVLDEGVGRQPIGRARARGGLDVNEHRVGAAAGRLDHRVALVDHVDVVAGAAGQHVGGRVGGCDQHVVRAVAFRRHRLRADEFGPLDVGVPGQQRHRKGRHDAVAGRDLRAVVAGARLDDPVTRIVDDVGVVGQRAGQDVGAGAAVDQDVAARVRVRDAMRRHGVRVDVVGAGVAP